MCVFVIFIRHLVLSEEYAKEDNFEGGMWHDIRSWGMRKILCWNP
jgi:hypothetical protein